MTDIKTVQALVDALMKLRKAADARGYDLMDNSYPQKYWYALRDQADGALDAGRALIAQMQRDAVQPVAWLRDEWNGTGMRSVQLKAPPQELPLREQAIGVIYTPLYAAPQPAPEPQQDQLQQPDADSTRASGVCASITPLDITLTRDEAAFIASFLIDDQEPGDDAVRLLLGEGHSGHGLYAAHPEYPEEGAIFVRAVAVPPAFGPFGDEDMPLDSHERADRERIAPSRKGADTARHGQDDHAGSPAPSEPVAVRYRDAGGRWRYLNFPFTKGWDFPASLGTPDPLYPLYTHPATITCKPLTKVEAEAVHRMPFVRSCLLEYAQRADDDAARAVVWAVADQVQSLRSTYASTQKPFPKDSEFKPHKPTNEWPGRTR